MWFEGGFATLVQNDSLLSVSVDYSNITKVLAIVGEAVKETKMFEKMIAVQHQDFKSLLAQERSQSQVLEDKIVALSERSEEQSQQFESFRNDVQSATGQLEKRVASLEQAIHGAAAISGPTDSMSGKENKKDVGNMEGLGLRHYAQANYEAIQRMQDQVRKLEEQEAALGMQVSSHQEGLASLRSDITDAIKCPVATELKVLEQLLAVGTDAQTAVSDPLSGWQLQLEGVPKFECPAAAITPTQRKDAVTLLDRMATDMRDVLSPLVADSHSAIRDAATAATRVERLLQQQQQQQQQQPTADQASLASKRIELDALMQAKSATDEATLALGRAIHERWRAYTDTAVDSTDTSAGTEDEVPISRLEAALSELRCTVEVHSTGIEELREGVQTNSERAQSNSEEIQRLRQAVEKAGGVEVVDARARDELSKHAGQLAELLLELERTSGNIQNESPPVSSGEGDSIGAAEREALRQAQKQLATTMQELQARIDVMVREIVDTCAAKADLSEVRDVRELVERMKGGGNGTHEQQQGTHAQEVTQFIASFREQVTQLWANDGALREQDQALHQKLLSVESRLLEQLRLSSSFTSAGSVLYSSLFPAKLVQNRKY
jgi:hypothetical protein